MIKSLVFSLNILFVALVVSYFAKIELDDIMIYTIFLSIFFIHFFFINENSNRNSPHSKH